MTASVYSHQSPFALESGIKLPGYHLGYHVFGKLNADKSNVVWIFHALTANSNPVDWWPGLVGPGNLLDPEKYFLVCVNMPGSCYGSIGPLENDPATGQPYYHDFPLFTTRDMIRAYQPLRELLGIQKIKIGIGGSMGGQQLLEWAIEEPELFEHIVPIATNAFHSPWGKAFNASQRLSIELDPTWLQRHVQAGIEGMKVARGLALLSYRHPETYDLYQNDADINSLGPYRSESYQAYQGEKLARRFNAFSYYRLSQSMDSHQVGRGRGSVLQALKKIRARTHVISLKSDLLFPQNEQIFLAENIPGAAFHSIHSVYGHDGFLLEYEAISAIIREFIREPDLSSRTPYSVG
ncbi:MAG: homoserine O-acetyltransferase [Bacteroidota bacterium]|nr:homoserine O-acetyltransferase [Bacteroidota bacterium]MDP4211734.1 homoserine O-acetyltransferase [Bacteroidota bacterium]MDP4251847.1 homoserine O-acetyltransferase [Bacteroidota bacterium]